MKIVPNTIVEELTLISHKRLPLGGSRRCSICISVEIPYIQAYHNPSIRNMEPATIRNIPTIAIDLLDNAFTFDHILHHFKLY